MFARKKVFGAIRFALFAAVLPFSPGAFAQQDSASDDAVADGSGGARSGEAADLERIEILGSRIKKAHVETASSVISIDRAQIDRSGLTQIGDLLREINVNGPSLGLQTNNGNINGNTYVNLRNCASSRTLVLVNGRRWITNNLLDGAVDLATIPLAVVERIDILKGGASALYGSDALCGVVNVQTRREFDGAMADAYVGQYEQGDGLRQAYSATLGGSGERWSSLLNVGYTEQDPVWAGDREISAVPLFGFPGTVSFPGRASSVTPYGGFRVGGVTLTLDPARSGCSPNQVCAPARQGDFRPYNFATDGYNFAPANFLVQPQKVRSLFASGEYRIRDDLRFDLELFYSDRLGVAQVAAQPLSPLTISAQSIYNPFGVDIRGASFRPVDYPRRFGQEQDTWRFSGGLVGDFAVGERRFSWDARYVYAENRQLQPKDGFYFSTRVAQATGPSFIDASGTPRCGTPAAPIPDCVPMNVMGGPAGFTRAMYDYISVDPQNTQKATRESFIADLSGDLLELPAGMLAFAVGYEHRRETGSNIPDPLTAAGLVLGDNPYLPTRGSFSADEAYLELQVPVLANLAAAKSLDLTLAVRRSDYSTFGSETTPWVGLRWQLNDDLLVRSAWGEGLRAPTVSELYEGVGIGRPSYFDPCSADNPRFQSSPQTQALCAATGVPAGFTSQLGQTFLMTGGNPDLKPETSATKSLGLVYSPDWAKGLDLYVDWYNIRIRDVIAARSGQVILESCYFALNLRDCGLITRDSVGAVNGNPGEVSNIFEPNRNFSGGIETEGFDFGGAYAFETERFGDFRIKLDASYVSYYGDLGRPQRGEVNADGEISAGNLVGTLQSNSARGAPRHRLRATLATTWTRGDFSATATLEYRSRVRASCSNTVVTARNLSFLDPSYAALRDLCTDPDFLIDEYQFRNGAVEAIPTPSPSTMLGGITYTHLQGSYRAPWDGTFTIGVRNAFDRHPPYAPNAFANSFDAQYLIPGRFFYVSYRHRF